MTVVQIEEHRGSPPGDPRALALPANVEVEQALLGALLINNDVLHIACAALVSDHFSEELHRRIYDVASAMIRDGRPANPITIKGYFSGDEIAPGMTMQRYLARLCADAVTVLNARDYANELVGLHGRRMLIAGADETRAAAFDPPAAASVDQLIDAAEARLAALRADAAQPTTTTSGTAGEMGARLLDKVRRIRAGEERPAGVATGLPDIDRDTGGLSPGQLWIVAGRPGIGKTIMATRFTRAAGRAGAGVILFSLEVNEEQINARLMADMAYAARRPIPFAAIMRGDIDDEALWRLEEAQQRFATMPIVIDCPSGVTLAQIGSRVRAHRIRLTKAGTDLKVVVIDYLDFIAASDRYKGNRVYEVAEISRGLKQLAKDQGLCVVLLAQLNRQVEQRPDKRPVMADLRDSGNLEQDADVVALLYREAYYLEKSPEFGRGEAEAIARHVEVQHQLELIIGKNRTGPTRRHHLWCDVACSAVASQPRGAA